MRGQKLRAITRTPGSDPDPLSSGCRAFAVCQAGPDLLVSRPRRACQQAGIGADGYKPEPLVDAVQRFIRAPGHDPGDLPVGACRLQDFRHGADVFGTVELTEEPQAG